MDYRNKYKRNRSKAEAQAEKRAEWDNFKALVRERGMERLPEIVSHFGGPDVKLQPIGGGWFKSSCPFHVEKTPSFNVSSQGYACHGAGCGAKGDVFTFIEDKLGMTFPEALSTVADYLGIPKPEAGSRLPKASYQRPEPRPVDPAEEYLASPDRLGDHNLRSVPQSLWVPKPGRFASIYREARIDNDGNVLKEAGIRKYKPEMVHQYRNVDDELKLVILRVRFSDGEKMFIPLQANDPIEGTPNNLIRDGVSWIVKNTGNDNRRPVYGAEGVNEWIKNPNRGPLFIIEGEKCKDFSSQMFKDENMLILSASGGFNSNILADWKEITDRMVEHNVLPEKVIIWPDADPKRVFQDDRPDLDVQERYAKQISSGFIRDLWASLGSAEGTEEIFFGRVIPPNDVEKGWDVADAINEGWTKQDLEAYIRDAVEVDLSHMEGHKPKNVQSSLEDEHDSEMSPS